MNERSKEYELAEIAHIVRAFVEKNVCRADSCDTAIDISDYLGGMFEHAILNGYIDPYTDEFVLAVLKQNELKGVIQ